MRLKLSGLRRAFESHAALDGLSLDLPETRTLVLIGPSGGGKSTLLRVLAGLERLDEGKVELNGRPLDFEPAALLAHRRRMGMVFQSFNLFPHLSALENITLPLTVVQGRPVVEAENIARELLRKFQLEERAAQKPAALSGGQRQRVAIARALAIEPQLLLLDEPTSALDPVMTAEVLDMIGHLRAQGRDFILATHEMGFARKVADQVALIAGGRLIECAPPDQFFESPQSELTRQFLACALRH